MYSARAIPVACLTGVVALLGAPEADPRGAALLSVLRPLQGVAIVVFEDLQCYGCAQAAPLIEAAARAFGVPVIRHDFPLPRHLWAERAAVWARYFQSLSQDTGAEFRDYIFANQADIQPNTLRGVVQRFAADRRVPLPDPATALEQFERQVAEDIALGRQIGIQRTPTVYVVSAAALRAPPREVFDEDDLTDALRRATRKAATFPTLALTRDTDCGCDTRAPQR